LTDEPAEQAVEKAILATEAGRDESVRIEREESPPIPISELPAKDKSIVTLDSRGAIRHPDR